MDKDIKQTLFQLMYHAEQDRGNSDQYNERDAWFAGRAEGIEDALTILRLLQEYSQYKTTIEGKQ